MSEIERGRGNLLWAGAMGAVAISTGIYSVIEMENWIYPTPEPEVSSVPSEVVFRAASDRQIAKGIKKSMAVCKVKNVKMEQLADNNTYVKIGCEPGTLKMPQQ